MSVHINYVKSALSCGLMANDCGGPQFMEASGQLHTLPSPNADHDDKHT